MSRRTMVYTVLTWAIATPRIFANGVPPVQTVFVILMENHNWSSILGSASAPYINNQLLPMASHAEQYYSPPGLHPSLPNYIWLEAGDNLGVTDDGAPATDSQNTTLHLATQLTAAMKTWKAYEEDIDGSTCPLMDVNDYAVRHDPFVYFTDITDDNNPAAPACISHVRPYAELASDLQNGQVANYNFITPNVCNDMHDCDISSGDTWLSREIPKIMNSHAYRNGGAIFITWDEAESGEGPIGMILLSPLAKGYGYSNTIRYTHSSLLLTVEEIFGLSVRLGDTGNSTDLGDLFSTPSQGPVQIVARHSGKCLDVAGISADPGALVQQWSCWGGPNQQWNLTPTGDASYEITSVNSGMSLDVIGGPSLVDDGVLIQQWPYWGGANQKWQIQRTSDGYYQLVTESSGKCLDVRGGPTATEDGVPVQQWSCSAGTNQQWQLVPAG